MEDIRPRLQSMEAAKPDKDTDPQGFKLANDKICREIDISRLWRAASGRKGVA